MDERMSAALIPYEAYDTPEYRAFMAEIDRRIVARNTRIAGERERGLIAVRQKIESRKNG